jgi:alkylation response protein AidB-like acyl-CoA dehydrogenase
VAILRAVSKADGSVGRILDGHFNGVERISVLAPEPLRSRELEAVAAGELLVGVWGADPIPGEGSPARLVEFGGRMVIEGVKTFCSGATGLDRALVLVRGREKGPPLVVYIGFSEGVEIDRSWYRGAGMRSSESHRVIFHETPVLAVLGEPGELLREPYFSRDAVRTAVCWAGIADRAVDATLETLAAKSSGQEPDDIISLAAGKMLAAQQTMDRWIQYAARQADAVPETSFSGFSIHLRESIATACRTILDEAARACGSHPFATAGALDRSRRDLELFLLQHRLEPALARAGRRAVQDRNPHS